MNVHGRLASFVVTFAAAFSVVYFFAVAYNWALFSYGPAVGQWTLFTQGAAAGPTMYWYGWIATSALAASSVAAVAAFSPQRLTHWLWPGFAWLIPIGSMAAFVYLLSGYFTR